MGIPDYDKALYFTMWQQWDDLLVLMVRTHDDILAKRIESFLNAFRYSRNNQEIVSMHEELLHYIDHAMETEPIAVM